jgi:hypothetical protein
VAVEPFTAVVAPAGPEAAPLDPSLWEHSTGVAAVAPAGGEPEPIPEAPAVGHPGEAVRRKAVAVLDRAETLRTRDGSVFPPLVECLAVVSTLREAIATAPAGDLPGAAEGLAGGEHPVNGLLTVIEGIEGLNDAEWAEIHSRVSEAFGRQLAVAAARGRIVLPD